MVGGSDVTAVDALETGLSSTILCEKKKMATITNNYRRIRGRHSLKINRIITLFVGAEAERKNYFKIRNEKFVSKSERKLISKSDGRFVSKSFAFATENDGVYGEGRLRARTRRGRDFCI